MDNSNTNKRKRTEGKQQTQGDDVQPAARQLRMAGLLDDPRSAQVLGGQTHPWLQGSLDRRATVPSEALLSAGNYALLNQNAATLRSLPQSTSRGAAPYAPPFFPSTSATSLGGYLGPSLSAQAGLLGQQSFMSVQAQAHVQAQAQAQALAVAFDPAQRGLLMQPPAAFNIQGTNHQASQIPNLPLSTATATSLAVPPESPLLQQRQQVNAKSSDPSTQDSTSAVSAVSTAAASLSTTSGALTGRPPVPLYMPCDDAVISRYQCLARQQMELFEAQEIDVEAGAQGRNRGIVLGQVGIRCKHCSHLYPRRRTKSSTFYPSKLKSIYQTAQNMANTHLTHTCQYIPKSIRDELRKLAQDKKTSAGGGKEYWSDGARILGVYETESFLRFNKHSDYMGSQISTDGSKAGRP